MSIIAQFCDLFRNIDTIELDELGKIYTKDVEFIDPIDHHRGIEEVKHALARMLEHAESCKFHVYSTVECLPNSHDVGCVVTWNMQLVLKKTAKTISVNGISQLKIREEGIYFHRDYYDLGEMVYEHVPLVGWAVKRIKRKLKT